MKLNLNNQTQSNLKIDNSTKPKIWFVILQSFLVILLVLAFLLSIYLPITWSWENGPIEWFQVIILVIGSLVMLGFGFLETEKTLRHFWFWIAPLLLIMASRETSWGAAFYPPQLIGVNGPVLIKSATLWYGKAIYPILAVIIVVWLIGGFYHKFFRLVFTLLRNKAFPLWMLLITLLVIVIATLSEKHIFTMVNGKNVLLEELMETVFYFGIIFIPIGIKLLLSIKNIFISSPKR